MIRTLLIIAGAALVLCVATLSGAAAIGGNELARHGWEWTFHDEADRSETVTLEVNDIGPTATRNLAWTGGDTLTIEIPGDVTYVQGDTPSVVVTGRTPMVDRVSLVDGRLTWDEGRTHRTVVGWGRSNRLKVVITAPSVTSFDLESSADLSIRGYDQPTFDLKVSGSGDVEASGQTQTAILDVNGSGDSDLSALDATDARIEVSGSGDVRVGPTGTAWIDISGSGDVHLTRRPANLQQTLSGSGDIDQN